MHDKPLMRPMTVKRASWRYNKGSFYEEVDDIAAEYPLTIMLNGEEFATMVCTPTDLQQMVVGFLASEGVIRFYNKEVKAIDIDEDEGMAYAETYHQPKMDEGWHSRRFIGSCCGKSRQSFYFHNDVRTVKTAITRQSISPERCITLMSAMEKASHVFKGTGGVHNAALCDQNDLLLTQTDIGRHNALDKLYGYCLMNDMAVQDKILTFSGRISSEILIKAAKIGVGIVLSKAAPTDLALQMAEELNITTIGFIREGRMNIYTHEWRIEGS